MMIMATNCVSDSGDYCANTLPKPIHLVKRSNAGKTIELLFSGRFFSSGFRLLEELSKVSLLEYSINVVLSDSESFTFIRALITRFLVVEWRVNQVLT